eukprot:11220500-Lingulodinium_polyedra.AAC.1
MVSPPPPFLCTVTVREEGRRGRPAEPKRKALLRRATDRGEGSSPSRTLASLKSRSAWKGPWSKAGRAGAPPNLARCQ